MVAIPHSLRAGFVSSAVKRGANLIKITDVTGHNSLEMLKTYSRDAEAFVGFLFSSFSFFDWVRWTPPTPAGRGAAGRWSLLPLRNTKPISRNGPHYWPGTAVRHRLCL
jgi:hypothetical protein